MAKMWAGTAGVTDPVADDFNSSIRFDCRMYRRGHHGLAWPTRPCSARSGILSAGGRRADHRRAAGHPRRSGQRRARRSTRAAEDIHMFVEAGADRAHRRRGQEAAHRPQPQRSGGAGPAPVPAQRGRARSSALTAACSTRCSQPGQRRTADTIMPGYTHLQRAQPVTFGHHLMAYAHDAAARHTAGWTTAGRRMNVIPARLLRAGRDDLSHRPRVDGRRALGF